MDNPRYTGYAFFGRWAKQETLLDPDDVAAGHVTRFRRAAPTGWCALGGCALRDRGRGHLHSGAVVPPIPGGGWARGSSSVGAGAGTGETAVPVAWVRPVRVLPAQDGGHAQDGRTYYRCVARTLAPGAPALAEHPKNVYLPERAVLGPLNAWVGELFDRENIDQTVAALIASQDRSGERGNTAAREALKRRLNEAQTRLARLRAAVEAGVDPVALVEAINDAQAQRWRRGPSWTRWPRRRTP